ncbi:MAG: calcium/sodium antiporter [Bacilli bacterium]|nr:calcium/sodium antiporter [Bacilli bacterium]MCI9435232.1 calcium/sodium antiporter [Bacilli bacterium]
MLWQTILLIVGFVILIKGADIFVDGASSLAQNFKLSKMLIGLTIVAFGTSAPEFAVSVKSIISNNADMVLGNVVGSNILNILLIIGICSLIKPIVVKNNTIKKEIPIVIMISTLLFFLMKDNLFDTNVANMITRNDGFIILLFFMIFIYYLISIMRNKKDEEALENAKFGMSKSIIFTILGIVCIIIGSNFVVDSASNIAVSLGVSQKMIALTIVAFGTSLPELVTSIVSIKKGEQEILVGNIVGSNVFNIGMVLGLPVALFGGIPAVGFNNLDLIVLLLSALLLFVFSFKDHKIKKMEGIIMLVVFAIYYSFVIIG